MIDRPGLFQGSIQTGIVFYKPQVENSNSNKW